MPVDVFILGGARTPMGSFVGPLKDVSATDLGVAAAKAAFTRTGVKPETVDHVVFGNVMQTSADAIYSRAPRRAARAGVPIEVPALTVNRCAARASRRPSAAQMIQLGEAGSCSAAASRA